MQLSRNYDENVKMLSQALYVDKSFDIVLRELIVSETRCALFFIDTFTKDEILERIIEFLLKEDSSEALLTKDLSFFEKRFIPYIEVTEQNDVSLLVNNVLSGPLIMILEGFDRAIVLDARTYPLRNVSEPKDDRVIRGSHDGFVETLVFNTGLIRRRIRDANLRMEYSSVGSVSKSDIVITYMEDKVDHELLKHLQDRLDSIEVKSLTMAQESISEALIPQKWYDPFPKVKYSERPDVIASNVMEGKIALLLDNSPSALILPTSFFDFFDEAQDYYSLPITGTYFKILRLCVFLTCVFLTPLWYLAILNAKYLPGWLDFILIEEAINVPLVIQLILMEFGIDAIKLASLNTPQALSGSFSIIAGLILGDFAISAGWLNGEAIFYMAFVALANFTQVSYELGYAAKYTRVTFLILITCLNWVGFIIGLILLGYILVVEKGIFSYSYLYPLYPFNKDKFKNIFFRKKLKVKNR